MSDSEKQLDAVLSYLAGRRLRMSEILDALEMSRSTYYLQRDEGRLITADNLIRAARNLGLNEVDLLARYDLVTIESAAEYVEDTLGYPMAPTRRGVTTAAAAKAAMARPRPKMAPRRGKPPL
jgi:hypothetical protein